MSLLTEIKSAQIPAHIAIIMDGNGRWAKQRNLPRTSGHKEGLEVAKKIVKAAKEVGIKYITLYTFSTENWKRTQDEVGYLMGLIKNHLRAEFKFYKENDIRVKHIGNLSGLPQDIQDEINSTIEECKDFNSLTVVLAINYGGKDEISRAINKAKSTNKEINENNFTEFFDLPEMPDVDLIIRTGGEKRLSNFLLWHGAYAELDFVDTLWPDYNEECFYQSIKEFQKRNRRFGGL